MRLPAKIVAWVLPWVLTGCWFHKNQKPVPAPVAPKIDTASSTPPETQVPATNVTIPTQPQVSETKLPYQSAKQPPKHKKPTTTPPDTQQAAIEPPAVNAIGTLSSGDPAGARYQTEAEINDIEKGLNGITRPFSDQEQTTASHIREFIKMAREALKSGDVDGASTLTAKAKVLLQELTH